LESASRIEAFQLRRQLALLGDALHDRLAPLLQLAQVSEALLQRAQLHVVEPAGHFLAIARHEGHRGPVVEQGHRRGDLFDTDAEFVRDSLFDAVHCPSPVREGHGLCAAGRYAARLVHNRRFCLRLAGYSPTRTIAGIA
jgi:hypothetical protein